MAMFGCSYQDAEPEIKEWFDSLIKDKQNTSVILWSNDIGDEIAHTKKFKFKYTNDETETTNC
jgi:hypothetical protein